MHIANELKLELFLCKYEMEIGVRHQACKMCLYMPGRKKSRHVTCSQRLEAVRVDTLDERKVFRFNFELRARLQFSNKIN